MKTYMVMISAIAVFGVQCLVSWVTRIDHQSGQNPEQQENSALVLQEPDFKGQRVAQQ